MKRPLFGYVINSLLFVDIYLLLSGYLFFRILYAELERRKGRLNPLILYIGRYIRLTPAYMVVIGFYMTWFTRIGDGPIWRERIEPEQDRCLESWWLNIMYVNNYINSDKLVSLIEIPRNERREHFKMFVYFSVCSNPGTWRQIHNFL